PPYYLTQVDSTGNFNITNIKAGKYFAYAWLDDNNSLKAEYKTEAFDFITDTIRINKNTEGINFNLSKGDQNPIKLTRSSSIGSNYYFVLNKNPVEVIIENEKIGSEIFYTVGDKRINLFSNEPMSDSLSFRVNLIDSVGYQVDSLIWGKFEQSDRKPEKLTITPNSGKAFYQTIPIELAFNKPLKSINYDSLYV